MITLLKKFGQWIKHWFWSVPTAKPPKEIPIQPKATEVIDEWMVITYHGQRIPMRKSQYPIWKAMSREDKRAMKNKVAKQEKQGIVRFEEVDGKTILVRNLDYQRRADKLKK